MTVKLCRDCRHAGSVDQALVMHEGPHRRLCHHAESLIVDYVEGTDQWSQCDQMRAGLCGPEGSLWEAKA